MKGNIHILSLYDVILLIPNPPVLSRLTLHNFKSSILLYWYTTNAHGVVPDVPLILNKRKRARELLSQHIFGHIIVVFLSWHQYIIFTYSMTDQLVNIII